MQMYAYQYNIYVTKFQIKAIEQPDHMFLKQALFLILLIS